MVKTSPGAVIMSNDPWAHLEVQQPSAKPEWLTEDIQQQLEAYGVPLNQDGMLMAWQRIKAKLDQYKETEMQYRKICAAFLVPAKIEGTTTVELGNDYKAKVNHKYNYKLDKDNNKIWASLDKIKKIGNIGTLVADRLVSWSPSFLKTEYNNLQEEAENGSEQAKEILKIVNDEMLTIVEAAPTVTIVEPKVKNKCL